MKICSECKNEVEDGMKYCPVCGTKVADSSRGSLAKETVSVAVKAGAAPAMSYFNGKIVIGILAGIMALAVFVGIMSYKNSGYESVVDKYFTAVANEDPKMMLSLVSEDWKTYMKENMGYRDDDLLDYMRSRFISLRTGVIMGDEHPEISCTIEQVYQANFEELCVFRKELYDQYGNAVKKWDSEKISDVVALSVKFSFEQNGKTHECVLHRLILMKEKNKWKVAVGNFSGLMH